MISKNRQKYIRSLALKKFRDESNCFVAEGPKVVDELMPAFSLVYLAATSEWLQSHPQFKLQEGLVDEVTQSELGRVSFQKTPQQVLAVMKRTTVAPLLAKRPEERLCLALDGVQNAGNLGTILRIADWFGIDTVFCSPDTADAFSPKAVQATMGALARIQLAYGPLEEVINGLQRDTPIYGTLLDGDNIYSQELEQRGLLVMGSEGNGLSESIRDLLTHRLYIPNYPEERETIESLNVAVATAIVCAEFRRRK